MILPNEKRKKLEELLFAVSPEGKKLESYQSLALGVKEKIGELARGIENAVDKNLLLSVLKQQDTINKEISDNINEVKDFADKTAKSIVSELEKLKEQFDKIPKQKQWGSWGTIMQPANVWGLITGTLSKQTDLQNALNALIPYTGAVSNADLNNKNLLNVATLSVGSATPPSTGVAYFSDNVGIGTTSPSSKLEIQGGNLVVGGTSPSTITGDGTVSTIGGDLDVFGFATFESDTRFPSGQGTIVFRDTDNTTDWAGIYGESTSTIALQDLGVSGFSAFLNVGGLSADRTFTFPDLTGTFTLLENPQTFTGTKTFSNATYSALFTGGNVGIGTTAPAASLDVNGNAIIRGPIRLKGYTVATLPTGTQGDTAYVTDATTPTYLGALIGGGTTVTPVFYDGTAWVSY